MSMSSSGVTGTPVSDPTAVFTLFGAQEQDQTSETAEDSASAWGCLTSDSDTEETPPPSVPSVPSVPF